MAQRGTHRQAPGEARFPRGKWPAVPSGCHWLLASQCFLSYATEMTDISRHRKRVRHFDDAGHVHELTFSCYDRLPLLTNDERMEMLARAVDAAASRHGFALSAFVFMPEHVHLLVYPLETSSQISSLLKAIKQPFSNRVRQGLEQGNLGLLRRLTVQERPGKTAFRFWQEGGGFDRNLTEPKTVRAVIDYLHLNPVRRGMVSQAGDYRWSSFHFYESAAGYYHAILPIVTPLPASFWDGESAVKPR